MPQFRPRSWTGVATALSIFLLAVASPAAAAVDIDATFSGQVSLTSVPDWTSVHLPNPGGVVKKESFALSLNGPLGSRYATFLLDKGYKVGRSTGERTDVTGQWGASPNNTAPASPFHDAEEGSEYWYVEAFRIPVGFQFGPKFTIVSEWHSNAANTSKPLYPQAPWKLRISPHLNGLYFNVYMNTGKQFGNNTNSWEINGWNPAWGSTEPSGQPRVPTTNTQGRPAPAGNSFWLAPVTTGKWQYFLYRIRWRNSWTGIFECWTRTEDTSQWTKVANYRDFPTHVYQDGDLNTNHYAVGAYYRGDGGTRQSLDYGGRARSNLVADAGLGADSSGFRELAALARFGAPAPAAGGESDADPTDPQVPPADPPPSGDSGGGAPGSTDGSTGAPSGGRPSGQGPGWKGPVAHIAKASVPRRGRLVLRVRGAAGAKVRVTVRGPNGRILARSVRRVSASKRVRYRLYLRHYRHQRVLKVRMKARFESQTTRARARFRLSRRGHRITHTWIHAGRTA